ncbi:hypothetical protein FOZ60_009136 [Perkinsus olseni]|uniref:Uncharacterized protein n=1 Tax=Perkinsus olseni TaxID=32597 RepID=A0A7J6QW33_PEROL|nr:hypothetical protein FOZ60_009136 [Perkinsus olseni]KAF4712849.1 hypothetical protein FOZ62_015226 [Perkinsus olseni]
MCRGSPFMHLLSVALLWIPTAEAVPVTVAVTAIDKLNASGYRDLFEAGVEHVILAGNWLGADGSIIFPREWMTIPLAEEIHNYAVKYNGSVSLGVVPQPFIVNSSRSLSNFAAKAQATIKDYNADGLLFELWVKAVMPTGDQWNVVNNLTNITRTKLKSSRGYPATASIMFGAESLSSSLWEDLKLHQPWNYTDRDYCLLDTDSVDYKTQISGDWADRITARLLNYSANISHFSFTIIPDGRYDNLSNAESYRNLIDAGAPAYGDGHFKHFYYNSQKQVEEKAQLVTKRSLHGLSILFPAFDLPPTNTSSLLHAALQG